jgi:hypothetical protein
MQNGRIKSFLAHSLMHYGPVLFFVVLVSTLGAAQQKKPRAMTGSAAAGGAPANL